MNLQKSLLALTTILTMSLSQTLSPHAHAQQAQIVVHAHDPLHTLSPYMVGGCIEDVNHEIYGGLYSQMVYGESFQEPPLSAKIEGFHAYGGDWKLDAHKEDPGANEVSVSASDGPKLVLDAAPISKGTIYVQMLLPDKQGGPAGIIVKVKDADVGADRFTGYEISLDPSQNLLVLGRHRQNWEPLKSVPYQVPVGQWIHLAVKMTATDLDITVDTKHLLSYHDVEHPLTAGTIGLRPWRRPSRYRSLGIDADPPIQTSIGAVSHGNQTYRFIPFLPKGESRVVSGMWSQIENATGNGMAFQFGLDTASPFLGRQSQQIEFLDGTGEVGIENRGLNRWGMGFQENKPYEGTLWARSKPGTKMVVALQSADGKRTYAETVVQTKTQDWERLTFTLTPNQTDPTGRMAILLRQPGKVTLGYASLHPGAWGRYHNLPVRKDVAEGLKAAGLTVLRYGGSMVNVPGYRWKQMVGPREKRPPYPGMWYPYASNGWGIPDFLAFTDAAGLLGIPAFNMDETPQDMADFIEYANGPVESKWGQRRAEDGHPKPFHIKYIELGNEEAVNESYWQRFEPMIRAIWAKDPSIIPVVGDFAYDQKIVDPYHFTGAPNIQSLAAHKKILDLAKQLGKEVWFDVHVWNQEAAEPHNVDGVASFSDQLGKISPGTRYKIVVFELNANKHGVQRALGTAHAINQLQRLGDRVRIVCSANGLQPDGQNDNGWDQGLLFLNPSKVWSQPPLYAMTMLAQNALHNPICVRTQVQDSTDSLDVTTLTDAKGKILGLQVVNFKAEPITTQIHLEGFQATHPQAQVTTLTGPLDAVNSATNPQLVTPTKEIWTHNLHNGQTTYTFKGYSFTILRFQ